MNDIAGRKAAIPLKPAARRRPTQAEVEDAVRTLIAWTGDDPTREGLRDTPRRVAGAFEEYYSGYRLDPNEVLSRTFEEMVKSPAWDDIIRQKGWRDAYLPADLFAAFLAAEQARVADALRSVGLAK